MQKEEMYLHRRTNGFYYFRRRVPADLAATIESKQFHFSLGTNNRRKAMARYSAALAESEHIIAKELKRLHQTPPVASPTWKRRRLIEVERAKRRRTRAFCQYQESDIRNLVSQWFHNAAHQTEQIYRDSFTTHDADQREEILQDLGQERRYLVGELSPVDELIAADTVRAILDEEDCDPPREWLQDPLFRRFYGLIREGLLRLNEIAIALVETGQMPHSHAGNDSATLHDDLFATTRGIGKSVTLNELIDRFEQSPRRQHLRRATRAEYQLIYRALREHVGPETPIHLITRDKVNEIADTFLHLPSRATLLSPKRPLRQLALDAKQRNLPQAHPKTYNKKVQQISAIFSYAVAEGLLPQHLAKNLSLPEPPSSGDDKGFTSDQLNVIFSGCLFSQFIDELGSQFVANHPLRPCYFWVPLLGLHQGLRSGEILQLKTANVAERDGVMALKIEGIIKNHYAFRWVPLHPQLIRFGFLRYVENVRAQKHERLFPDAGTACDGKQSTWFQKPWARYLIKIGIKHSRKECFHSFRHTWTAALRRADVPEEIRRILGGWKADGSAESGYGAEHLPRLLKYIEKVNYPGLILSHLYREQIR